MKRACLFAAAALLLAACGEGETPETAEPADEAAAEAPAVPDFSDEAAADLAALREGGGENAGPTPGDWDETPLRESRIVYFEMCQPADSRATCDCQFDRLIAEHGPDAALAIGVIFGGQAALAGTVNDRLTETERAEAADAYLQAKRHCAQEAPPREQAQ